MDESYIEALEKFSKQKREDDITFSRDDYINMWNYHIYKDYNIEQLDELNQEYKNQQKIIYGITNSYWADNKKVPDDIANQFDIDSKRIIKQRIYLEKCINRIMCHKNREKEYESDNFKKLSQLRQDYTKHIHAVCDKHFWFVGWKFSN